MALLQVEPRTEKALLSNLTVILPKHKLHSRPLHGCLTYRLTPEEERNEEEEAAARDTCHSSIRGYVPGLINPGVCVEGKEKAEAGYES